MTIEITFGDALKLSERVWYHTKHCENNVDFIRSSHPARLQLQPARHDATSHTPAPYTAAACIHAVAGAACTTLTSRSAYERMAVERA